MSKQPDPSLWQLTLTLPLDQADRIADLFEDEALTVSTEEAVPDGSL